jgi:hypothetical protein
MRFMMLMIPQKRRRDEAPDANAVAAMVRYNESLERAGVLQALVGLHPPAMGARLSFSGGKAKVTDVPLAEKEEAIGYWMIQVKSKEEAIEWASRCPTLDHDVIELRQVQDFSDFPQEVQEAAFGLLVLQKGR